MTTAVTITGATRVAGIIGDPVRHSLSPVLHNAAYRELGLDWVYVAFEVPAGVTRDALGAMRALDLAGLSVTMPHKTAAAEACDELSVDAAALHSVAMEGEDLSLVPYAVFYRFVFITLVDVAKLFATVEQLFNTQMTWGKLERAGRI